MSSKLKLTSIIKSSVFAVTLLAISGAANAQKLTMTIFFPPSHFSQDILRDWAKDVEKATEGRVTIEIPAGSLAPPPQQLSAVKNGIADIALTANIFLSKKMPLLQFSSLPFLVDDAKAASVAHYRTYQKHLADLKQFKGVELLSTFHFAGGHIYTLTDTKINSKSDLLKTKIWALPGAAATTMKDIGVSPVTGPAVKVSEPVSQGVVEMVYGISPESVVDFKASPYVKNITLLPKAATSTSFSFFANSRAWKKISKADQAAIMALSGEALSTKMGTAAHEAGIEGIKKMKAAGIETMIASDEFIATLKAAAQKQFDDFNKDAEKVGKDGNQIIEDFKAEMKSM